MHLTRPIRLAATFVLAAAGSHAAAPKLDLDRITPVPDGEPIPLQDFFRPAILRQPEINLTGTHIAAVVTAGQDRRQLLVHNLQTQKFEMFAGAGDKDVYGVTWLNESRLVFNLSTRKMYGLGLMAADVGALSSATPLLQYYGSSVVAVPPKDRLHPLVWNRYDSLETYHDLGAAIVNTNLRTGRIVNLAVAGADYSAAMDARDNNDRHIVQRFPVPTPGLSYQYLADREGHLAFALNALEGQLTLFRFDGGKWLKCPVDLEQIDVIGAGDEPGQLIVLGPRQPDLPRALQVMDAATGKFGEVLLQDKAYDFAGWLYRNPATQETIGAFFERNGPRVVWFSEEYRGLQKVLDGFFPGLVVRIIGSDEAQGIFLVETFSDRQPVIYNWVDLRKHTVGLIKNSAPWIDPKRMQPMNVVKFKTRDGRQLDAYLTLPAGATKQNPPPLVVLCHGGPWARDSWGFNGEAQFLASRGYAVLQPNYRGSTGYDWMFPVEDRWDFFKMHQDVTDATRSMIGSGLVDPKRIGIMGGSFGGYQAIAGVVNEPELYRCAVTIAGVFDWETQIRDTKYGQYDSPVFGRMMHMLGDPHQQKEKFERISPGRHTERIRVPVFVAGGKDDNTVEIEQSKALINGLERNKVPYEKLLVSEEGHGMGHLDNQVELYSRIETFLAKNLMAAP